jgi:hypothetical protein
MSGTEKMGNFMGLLVEYTLLENKSTAQVKALKAFVSGLNSIGDDGYQYTAYETDDPTRFIAIFEFDDDAAKRRFLDSAPFNEYRDKSTARFTGPPSAIAIREVASTRGR